MRCRRSKTSEAQTERTWQKIWLRSIEKKRETTVNGDSKTFPSTTSFQLSKLGVKWFFGCFQENSQRRTGSCCPSEYWTIHISQVESIPEKSKNQAKLENSTYEQIVSHPQMEVGSNDSKARDELQMNSVTQHATKTSPEKPKRKCHHCKKPGRYRNQCRQSEKWKTKAKATKTVQAKKQWSNEI